MRPAAQAPGRRWPKFLAVAGIVACALGLGAWTIHRHLTPDWSENALGEDFGADHPWSGNTIRPFLLDGELVGRVDLKADRAADALHVVGAFVEPGRSRSRVAAALTSELATMASWLGLGGIAVGDRGDLAGELRSA